MPSLIRRNNGIYYAIFSIRGKRKWISLDTREIEEAKQSFNERTRSLGLNNSTMESFWQELEPILAADRSPKTMDIYRQATKNLLKIVHNKRLSSISSYDIEKYKISRVQKAQKVTVNKELRALRALFSHAIRLGFLRDNPAAKCAMFRVSINVRFMSEEEFERLYDEIDDVSFEELVAVAVTTAMRAGEIASLECCDIDFDGRRIELRNKSFHLVKGGKERSIPMSDIVCEILKSRAVHQGRVFLNAKGRPYSVKALSDRFRRYRRKAGLPEGIRFHTLRHTAITWMHQNGVPSEFIRQIAGHSSILTTHLYTHASPGHLLAASNTLSDWVKSVIQLNKNEPRIGFSV